MAEIANEKIEQPRFYEIDILRFFAALAVVLFHYTFLNLIGSEVTVSYPVLGNIFKYGYLGVELFFMISGFVILLTALKKDWTGFAISRFARLYPAFWLAVILTTIVITLFGSDGGQVSISQFFWNLTMLGDFVGVENIDSVYWTLQVEIKFYFWIFVILLLRKIQSIEFFLSIWLFMSVLTAFHLFHETLEALMIPEWAPLFSAGALFYRIKTQGVSSLRIVLLVLAYALSLYFAMQGAELKTKTYNIFFSPLLVASIITVFYLLFALITLGITRKLYHPWLMILGVTTYPLYLIHQKIGQIVFLYVGDAINKYVLLIGLTLAMILFAYMIHRYYEAIFGKWIKRTLENRLM